MEAMAVKNQQRNEPFENESPSCNNKVFEEKVQLLKDDEEL